MPRAFQQHNLRWVQSLDGLWDFAFLGEVDPDDVDVEQIVFDDRMSVPGCFDAAPRYAGRRGLAAYRRPIVLHDDTPHRLVLDGVHHWGRVFVGGEPIGDHVGGFTRFALDITARDPGLTDLVILVDNRFDFDRCPLHLEYFDWYHYGGIARGVELHRLGGLWIESVRVTTEDYATRRLGVAIEYGSDDGASAAELAVSFDGETIVQETMELGDPAGRIEFTVEVEQAALWSPRDPVLHELHVFLGADDYRERVGIRQVAVQGRQILLNGEPLQLRGFCRHEAHPQFGHALPEAIIAADVQLLKDAGCNFVRGSHYPQDQRFLDLCDEAGICVWCEAIGWQHTSEHLNDPDFIKAQLDHIEEMVSAAYNHPSVILWGALNEGISRDAECREGYQALLGAIRELDDTRLVTYASMFPVDDLFFDLVDVIGINCYPGWYGWEFDKIPEQLNDIFTHLDGNEHADKPLIISEIGAGAIYGWRDAHEARWTEQYQARLLDVVLRHLLVDTDRACGVSLWQFCDCRTSEHAVRALGRPRCFNNKGVLDEYRRPKLAYEVVTRLFTAQEQSRE